MAETNKPAGNTAVPETDHDRVAMLSVRADGSLDQHNPEIIGDQEFAREATREQFRQQAVSAVDVRERGVAAETGGEPVEQDPAIAALTEKHQAAEKAAEGAADTAVDSLFTSESELQAGPAATPPAPKGTNTKK